MNQSFNQLHLNIDNRNQHDSPLTLLQELCSVLPAHLISEKQAKIVAERLAQRMRSRLSLDEDLVFPSAAIEQLPRIEVSTHMNLRDPDGHPQSGLSGWNRNRRVWVIAINGDDYHLRQRFSLMHEYGHVITGNVANTASSLERFLPSVGTYTSSERLENLCDHFAACLLMPRPLVKQAWTAGHQDVRALSRLFGVSKLAMRHRLHDIGLAEPTRRHKPYFGPTMYFRNTPTETRYPLDVLVGQDRTSTIFTTAGKAFST